MYIPSTKLPPNIPANNTIIPYNTGPTTGIAATGARSKAAFAVIILNEAILTIASSNDCPVSIPRITPTIPFPFPMFNIFATLEAPGGNDFVTFAPNKFFNLWNNPGFRVFDTKGFTSFPPSITPNGPVPVTFGLPPAPVTTLLS